jgi:hypothetical protein
MARKGRDWPAHGLLHGLVQPHQNPNPFPGSLTASPCSAAAPSPSPRSALILTPPHSSLPLSHSVTLSVSHPSLPHARRWCGPSQGEVGECAARRAPPGRGRGARDEAPPGRAHGGHRHLPLLCSPAGDAAGSSPPRSLAGRSDTSGRPARRVLLGWPSGPVGCAWAVGQA